MASLLLTAFPTPEAVVRRTADAGAAISASIAASGMMHQVLTDAGYVDTSGNHYVKGDRELDLLVPSPTAEFVTEDRELEDSMPRRDCVEHLQSTQSCLTSGSRSRAVADISLSSGSRRWSSL